MHDAEIQAFRSQFTEKFRLLSEELLKQIDEVDTSKDYLKCEQVQSYLALVQCVNDLRGEIAERLVEVKQHTDKVFILSAVEDTMAELNGTFTEVEPELVRVRALVDIHDEASMRAIPQHAKAGDIGVVEGYFSDDDVPTVNWNPPLGTGFGVYDVPWSQLEVVK